MHLHYVYTCGAHEQAAHNSSNVGDVSAGQAGHNSSINNDKTP